MRKLLAAVLVLIGVGSCFTEPDLVPAGMGGSGGSGGETVMLEAGAGGDAPACVAREPVEGAECRTATSSEPLRARIVENTGEDSIYFTDTLYGEFNSLCGSCHIASNLGGFGVTRATFAKVVDETSLAAMRSDEPECELDGKGLKLDASCFAYMPPAESPNGKEWSERSDKPNDPVTRLSALLEVWIDEGRPNDAFTVPGELAQTSSYAIDAEFAETFTNIGTCIPDAGMVATELDRSCELDARFAALEIDLTSALPNEQLGLPETLEETDLFTLDSAELARHGVVAYAPTYPLWSDDAGKLRHVRVPQGTSIAFDPETRRFDIPKNTRFYKTFLKKIKDRDGVERFRKIETRLIVARPGEEPLFGTYLWNEEETAAPLLTDPLNSGRPFKDRLLTIVTDVARADEIREQWQAGEIRNYSKELDYEGIVRRYAVPGSERCIQCHMGGENDSFILGFTPLQVNPRPCDRETLEQQGYCEGGVIEPMTGDQLTQLQRLVDYGIISNFDPATDLIKLEDPQGPADASRPPRNEHELVAQGYLLGNCAHCHNPDGYPSRLSPELAPLLDFLPSEDGGIFQFKLETYSPRILRAQGTIKLPYITPSLRDIFSTSPAWTPKEQRVEREEGGSRIHLIDAPWRSLIYRNVDTPFVYADDAAIFPHMPLNTPGFDCRAPRILGSWMVSIPALPKNPGLTEDAFKGTTPVNLESEPQPYYEVTPDQPNYLNALARAQKRLETYRNGLRGNNYCPDTSDIIDVWDILYGWYTIPRDGAVKELPLDGIPDRPHWVVTDLTDPPGEWNPRRTDWETIIVDQNFTASEKAVGNLTSLDAAFEIARIAKEKVTVELLQEVKLTQELSDFISKPVPFGLWVEKEGCDFSGEDKAGVYTAEERPQWLGLVDPATPVYKALPGAMVYDMICVNCHGPDGDSTGRQASTLQEMTGGSGRVANFKDGLFGPFGSGGANRERVFGSDELAMRYLLWMALGGTRTQIPRPILDLVASTPVLGVARTPAPVVKDANMLDTARQLCRGLVTRGQGRAFDPADLAQPSGLQEFSGESGLILSHGDAELWADLCTIGNPSPVHGIEVQKIQGGYRFSTYDLHYYEPSAYPANAAVGDGRGRAVPALEAGNDFPWCVIQPTDPLAVAWLATKQTSDGKAPPPCPPGFATELNRWSYNGLVIPGIERFAERGAMNAGYAVFHYLDLMISQGKGRRIGYTECEKLSDPEP
jgi:mono/diheme cytochrome c family protein